MVPLFLVLTALAVTQGEDAIAEGEATPLAVAAPAHKPEPVDPELQAGLANAINQLGLQSLVDDGRLGVALIDISAPSSARYAGLNDDIMMYAASLPKIAVLVTAFGEIESGRLAYTAALQDQLTNMIRYSSNSAASETIDLVGFDAIARTLEDPRYQLYVRGGAGGLWVGKAYDRRPAEARDPLFGISHGATPRQAVRFFLLLDQGRLVGPEASREMLSMLGDPRINHKFVKGLAGRPGATVYRKSGTWSRFHSDAALIERNGRRYIAAALVEDPKGNVILERLIVALDDLIQSTPVTQ